MKDISSRHGLLHRPFDFVRPVCWLKDFFGLLLVIDTDRFERAIRFDSNHEHVLETAVQMYALTSVREVKGFQPFGRAAEGGGELVGERFFPRPQGSADNFSRFRVDHDSHTIAYDGTGLFGPDAGHRLSLLLVFIRMRSGRRPNRKSHHCNGNQGRQREGMRISR